MYKRVLLKLSGEALKGNDDSILNASFVQDIAKMMKSLHDNDVEIAVVIGAGNIWRGKLAGEIGIERVPADFMGMIGTVINAVALSSALKNLGVESLVMSALPGIEGISVDYDKNTAKKALNEKKIVFCSGGTGKPYFTTDTAAALRAVELDCDAILMGKNGVEGVYDDDPRKNPHAKFIKDITYDEIMQMGLLVMDQSAVELIQDKDIDIRVFSMTDLNNFLKAAQGEDIGTTCHRKGK